MAVNSQEEVLKKKTFKRFMNSFSYAYQGMKYAFYHEVNIFVMIIMALIAMILGILLHINYVEALVVTLLIGTILSLEMINCSIEATVDLVTKEKKELAKIAKDCASGAVFLMSLFSVIIGIMIYVPKILEFIKR